MPLLPQHWEKQNKTKSIYIYRERDFQAKNVRRVWMKKISYASTEE